MTFALDKDEFHTTIFVHFFTFCDRIVKGRNLGRRRGGQRGGCGVSKSGGGDATSHFFAIVTRAFSVGSDGGSWPPPSSPPPPSS